MIETTSYSITNPRDNINKDRFLVDADRKIFVICDGVSSEPNASQAAQKVIEFVEKEKIPDRITTEYATWLLKQLNIIVYELKSGTTFTFLKLEKEEGVVIHTGDSECYRIKNDEIKEITTPFTIAYGLYKSGMIKLEDVKRHTYSNALAECLGHELWNPQLKRFRLDNVKGFILCSDGANYCQPELMKKFFNAEKIAKEALNKGSRDDITVITVKL